MPFDPYIHYKYNFKVETFPPSSEDGPDVSENRSKDAAFHLDYPLTFAQGESVDKYTKAERPNCQIYCRAGYIASGFFFPDAGSHCGGDLDAVEDQFLPKQSWFRSRKSTIQVDGNVYVLPGGNEAHRTKITAVTHPHFFNKPIHPVASGAIAKNNRWVMATNELGFFETGARARQLNQYKLQHYTQVFPGMQFWCSGEQDAEGNDTTVVHSEKCPDGFGRPGAPPKKKKGAFSYDWNGGEACLSCIDAEVSDPLGFDKQQPNICNFVRFSGVGVMMDTEYPQGSGAKSATPLEMVLGEERNLQYSTNELNRDLSKRCGGVQDLRNCNMVASISNGGDYEHERVGMGHAWDAGNKYTASGQTDQRAGRQAALSLASFEILSPGGTAYHTGDVGKYDGKALVKVRAVKEKPPCDDEHTLDKERIHFHMEDNCGAKHVYKIKPDIVDNKALIEVPPQLAITSITDFFPGNKLYPHPHSSAGAGMIAPSTGPVDHDWSFVDEGGEPRDFGPFTDYVYIHNTHPVIHWDTAIYAPDRVMIYLWVRTRKSKGQYNLDLSRYGNLYPDSEGEPQMAEFGIPELIYASDMLGEDRSYSGDDDRRWKPGFGHQVGKYTGKKVPDPAYDLADPNHYSSYPPHTPMPRRGSDHRYKLQVMVVDGAGIRGCLSTAIYFSIERMKEEGVWWE